MLQSSVYIFQGNCLVVPDSVKDHETAGGVDRDLADRTFGKLDYFAVPPLLLFEDSAEPPIPCFLLKDGLHLPSSWRTVLVRQLLSDMADTRDNTLTEYLLRCFHIMQWRDESIFCGKCGEKNNDSQDELARLCPRCGRIEYPRISPAVIVLIKNEEDCILLAHNNKFKNNMYSLIAGFAEAGESLEETVYREIREELGIDVTGIHYEKSQSWPFPNSLMIGFTARYAGGVIKPDGKEIADARWFSRKVITQSAENKTGSADKTGSANIAGSINSGGLIPDLPMPGSISRYLINRWLEGFIR